MKKGVKNGIAALIGMPTEYEYVLDRLHTLVAINKMRERDDGSFYQPHAAGSPISIDATGGINLNPALLDLQVKRDGNGIPLPFNLQPATVMNIEGFIPVIINITPVINLPMLLGWDVPETEDKPFDAAKAGSSASPMDYKYKYIREHENA